MLWYIMLCVLVDLGEWQQTVNETQLNYINVTDLNVDAECEMLVVAVNDVGAVASRQIRVRLGMPYAQFGIFLQFGFWDGISKLSIGYRLYTVVISRLNKGKIQYSRFVCTLKSLG